MRETLEALIVKWRSFAAEWHECADELASALAGIAQLENTKEEMPETRLEKTAVNRDSGSTASRNEDVPSTAPETK